MDALAGANGKVMLAPGTDLQVLVQLLVEQHRAALRAFGPEPFGDIPLLALAAGKLRLLGKRRVGRRGRRRDRRFGCFQPQRLLGK
jgi:hypothetical protein